MAPGYGKTSRDVDGKGRHRTTMLGESAILEVDASPEVLPLLDVAYINLTQRLATFPETQTVPILASSQGPKPKKNRKG